MRLLRFLSLGILATVAASCTAPNKHDALAISRRFNEVFAPVYDISLLRSGAIGILYCSASFRHKHERWPKDYTELSAFVKQSDGYLMLGEYERVDFRPLPDDGLEICYVRPGHTNEMKLTLGSPKDEQ